MGKPGTKTMEEKGGHEQRAENQESGGGSRGANSFQFQRTVSTPAPVQNPTPTCHLSASTSSPSLLAGCGDVSTHAGAEVARHVHNHNVHISNSSQISDAPLSPVPDSPISSSQVAPFPHDINITSADSDLTSVFLTPAPPRRAQHSSIARPRSAPAHHLERISGTLLRLIGDHYLCCTCGRELRTIGDQLTMETSLNQIRNALSSGQLNMNNGDNNN